MRGALRYMNMRAGAEEPDAKLINNIKSGFEHLNNIMRPRKIYGVFNIVRSKNYLSIANINLNSLNLNNLLINSQDCCLMAVTLGHETDREILTAQNRSMADGLILDACASVMADVICDNLESEIIDNLNKKLTPRFSPGYGDVPLDVSQEIIEVLKADKYIGLSMTRSGMMSPVKSITAFAGVINNNLNFNFNKFNKCEACNNNQNCVYKL